MAGTTIAWGELGAGPPLVLLHGLWDSHRTWRRAAPLLARDFRVLMPDLPGHGWSGRPDAPYTLSWYARMVAAWMDAIGLGRAHVCGHSFGGGVAEWMLLQERPRVDRLALVAAGGLGREVGIWMRLGTFPVIGPAFTPAVMFVALPLALRLAPAMFGHIEPAEATRAIHMNRLPGTAEAFRRTLAGIINICGQYMSMIDRVHEIAGLPPLAAYWGTSDPIIPVHHGQRLLQRLTGVTLSTYTGCGHYPHLDAAARFAGDLREFLRDPVRPPAGLRRVQADRPLPAPPVRQLVPTRIAQYAAALYSGNRRV
ncbi:MAG TPA: alpha/beta fold hydrolase [Polyangia bacterium]